MERTSIPTLALGDEPIVAAEGDVGVAGELVSAWLHPARATPPPTVTRVAMKARRLRP